MLSRLSILPFSRVPTRRRRGTRERQRWKAFLEPQCFLAQRRSMRPTCVRQSGCWKRTLQPTRTGQFIPFFVCGGRFLLRRQAIGEAGADAILAAMQAELLRPYLWSCLKKRFASSPSRLEACGRGGSKARVLTICNTGSLATAGWGTALGVIRSLHARGGATKL